MSPHVTLTSCRTLTAMIMLALFLSCERSTVPSVPVAAQAPKVEHSRKGVGVSTGRNAPDQEARQVPRQDVEAYPVGGEVKAPILITRIEPALERCGQSGSLFVALP